MRIDLMQQGENVGMFINGESVTYFPNQTTNDVVGWIRKNITNTEIHIEGAEINGQ